jgi:putative ABC transport system permease protein
MNTLLQDVRYGFRMLAKAPAFTAIAIVTLALGIGANTAIFSAVYGIVLKPLPYSHPSQLVRVVGTKMMGDMMLQGGVSLPAARDIQAQCPAIEQAATYGSDDYTFIGAGVPEQLNGIPVSGNFFSLLGVRPLFGRVILPPDMAPGHTDVVVLSYAVWKDLLGSNPAVIGRKITLSGSQYTVVGIMPRRFDFGGSGAGQRLIWTPRDSSPAENANRGNMSVDFVARLKPDATIPEIQSQLKTLSARLAASYPKTDAGWELHADRLKAFSIGYLSQPLLLLLGAVGFVLLIACVNVSGLLLARGWGRQKEIAIRKALGATRFRIIQQFLCESILLALAGGALGLLLAVWGVAALRVIAPAQTPRLDEVQLSPLVLWFTLGVSLLAGVLFGLVPALQVSARRMGGALKESLGGSSGAISSRHPRKLRSTLVVIEVALAVILVVGATLVARSLAKLTSLNLGFRTDHVLTMTVNFSKSVCDTSAEEKSAQCILAEKDLLSRVKSAPGVENAAEASAIPLLSNNVALSLSVEGQSQQVQGANGFLLYRSVTPEYFSVMGMRLLKGRGFSFADVQGSEHVAIVSESFAKKYLSNQPLGKRISKHKGKNGQPEWMTIVGETADTLDFGLDTDPQPEFYLPLAQSPDPLQPNLIVRTAGDPMTVVSAVKSRAAAVDPNAPLTNMKTMDQILSNVTAQQKFQTFLLGAFGMLGLVLAMVGIYGMISYDVSQRTREIGVRMALGAQPGNVLRLVIREGMWLAGAGILVGIGGALAVSRALRSLLFEIKPTDPATFVAVALALTVVALAACYIPARRAMRVEPIEALRYE